MNAAERIWELAKKLRKLSTLGKLDWTKTAADGVYCVSFPNYTIAVKKTTDYNSPETIHLQFLNDDGEVIEDSTDEFISEQVSGLRNLEAFQTYESIFSMARSRALGLDEALNTLMDVLENLDPQKGSDLPRLGRDEPSKIAGELITDDDIPF